MDLLTLRRYGLILAVRRTFQVPGRRVARRRIRQSGSSVSHQATQIPSTDPGGSGIMGRDA
jgi:hypothetical protein